MSPQNPQLKLHLTQTSKVAPRHARVSAPTPAALARPAPQPACTWFTSCKSAEAERMPALVRLKLHVRIAVAETDFCSPPDEHAP